MRRCVGYVGQPGDNAARLSENILARSRLATAAEPSSSAWGYSGGPSIYLKAVEGVCRNLEELSSQSAK